MISNVKVGIIDYESGNTRSVVNAFDYLKTDYVLSNSRNVLCSCTHIVLPGVGSFGNAMDHLRDKNLLTVLHDLVIKERKIFLGICVGMQILAEEGEEFGKHLGLGWIKGKVKLLDTGQEKLRLPHVGWNSVVVPPDDFVLFKGLNDNPTFYFVHSYALYTAEKLPFCAEALYGKRFLAAIQKDNIFGVQFHPEKSQKDGIKLLANFCALK